MSLDRGAKTRKKMEGEKEVLRSQKATCALIAGRRFLQGEASTQRRIGKSKHIMVKHCTLYANNVK